MKKQRYLVIQLVMIMLLLGCQEEKSASAVTVIAGYEDDSALEQKMEIITESEKEESVAASSEPDIQTPEPKKEVSENPESSYGRGSARFLEGKNVLVSLFVDTPESKWSQEEKEAILAKIETAVSYIEKKAKTYGIEAELVYDFVENKDLLKEAETDFNINEEIDFVDRLDEEIALWKRDIISYPQIQKEYNADGIATMIFINNPGISYAIVFDGTDSEEETIILFADDYYKPGQEEVATSYAHEILHVFGAHDLYEEAEYTSEVSNYVSQMYPHEIMYTVAETGGQITAEISPITAYHLGWISEIEETEIFPQLIR